MKDDGDRELERQIVARVQSLLPFPVSPDELRTLTNSLVPFIQAERSKAALEAKAATVETAIKIVNNYSIHQPKGYPKGTTARLRLTKRLRKLTQQGPNHAK